MRRKRVYILHPKHMLLEYNQITEQIYLGTNQCCQTHEVAEYDKIITGRKVGSAYYRTGNSVW